MPSPFAIRAELIDLVSRDLLGPAHGPEEELHPQDSRVTSRYLLGALAPGGRNTLREAGHDAEEDEAREERQAEAAASALEMDEGTGEAIEKEPALVDSLLPSSAGFSCLVDPAETQILIHGAWGRYEKAQAAARQEEFLPDKKEKPQKMVWKRIPVQPEPVLLALRDGSGEMWFEADPPIKLAWRIRKRPDAWYVTLFIINAAPKKFAKKDEYWIFQVQLCAESPKGRAIFLPLLAKGANLELLDADERAEMEGLDLRHRHNLVFARGHGVAARSKAPANSGLAERIELDFLPLAIVPGQTPRDGDDDPLLQGIILDMKDLAAMPPDELQANLDRLARAYAVWTANLQTQTADSAFAVAATRAQKEAERALNRMRAGIATLMNDNAALEAFRFANQAMRSQRVHTVYAHKAKTAQPNGLEGKRRLLKDADIPANRSWRLFQLAFILCNMPTLANPLHPDRSGERAIADLFWFGTGGGKTEAYLGLTAFTLAMRRLKPNLGGLDASHGVGVFMRYTVRLLTLQQFQRAAALICACEVLRRKKPEIWGHEPFRLGLWVGAKSTSNSLEAASRSLDRSGGMAA